MSEACRQSPADTDIGAAFIMNFLAGPVQVRDALGRLDEFLSQLSLPEDRQHTIQLVLAEALNNVTEHAYEPGHSGPIYLRAKVQDRQLEVKIRDRGVPLPENLILPGGEAGFDPADLPEGGFGWHLIRTLAQELDHNRLARWNELKVVFLLS